MRRWGSEMGEGAVRADSGAGSRSGFRVVLFVGFNENTHTALHTHVIIVIELPPLFVRIWGDELQNCFQRLVRRHRASFGAQRVHAAPT